MEWHHNTHRPVQITAFEDYQDSFNREPLPENNQPWSPYFNTREDFEFGEVALEAALSKNQCKTLITLIQKCIQGKGQFTLTTNDDLEAAWRRAALKLTPVSSTQKHYIIHHN